MSASKGIVLLHSSASYAEGRVITGQSNAYADRALDLHTVLIARWQVKLWFAGMFQPSTPMIFQTCMLFIFNQIRLIYRCRIRRGKGGKACGSWYVEEGEKQVSARSGFRGWILWRTLSWWRDPGWTCSSFPAETKTNDSFRGVLVWV